MVGELPAPSRPGAGASDHRASTQWALKSARRGVVQPTCQRLSFFPRQVSRGRQVAGWGRSQQAVLTVGLVMMVVWTAACASAPVKIPTASATPSAKSTTIAPGVSVNPAELSVPPYSVSTSNPLPAGVSPRRVVMDVITDNLIENRAIERGDAPLLAYADSGGMLTIDQSTISTDRSDGLRILSINDSISSLVLGSEVDPNNPDAQAALNVEGVERITRRDSEQKLSHTVDDFHVLIWVDWSPVLQKYLRCDVSVL